MKKEREVVYLKHPVSPETKAKMIKAGKRIVDIRFKPAEKNPRVKTEADAE